MGKRAALALTCLAFVVFQCYCRYNSALLWTSGAQPHFYAVAPSPLAVKPPPMVAFPPRWQAPHMMAKNDNVLDQDWVGQWNYDTAYTQEDVQRRVMERLFRTPPAADMDPSKDAALQAAAKEVQDIAATFGKEEGQFAKIWVSKVMASQDPQARLDIIDECFVNMELNCQGLEDSLRRFRMLLAPHTALVKEAKKEVLFQASRQDKMKQAYVDEWLKKVEAGEPADTPQGVLEECDISTAMGGARSKDCFEFEEALSNYKAAAGLWTKEAPVPAKPLGTRLGEINSARQDTDTS